MSLKFTDTELFAKIWQRMYEAFGKVNISDGKMSVMCDLHQITITPELEYDYDDNFNVGETVYAAMDSDNKRDSCLRGVVESKAIAGWFNIRISDGRINSFVNHVKHVKRDKIARHPSDFEGTWVIRIEHYEEVASEIREVEKWQKRIPTIGGPNPHPSKREVTFYPRDIAEMEEIIDCIANVIAD